MADADILPDVAVLLAKPINTSRADLLREITERESERSALRAKVAEFEDWGLRLRKAMCALDPLYYVPKFAEGTMQDMHWRMIRQIITDNVEFHGSLSRRITQLTEDKAVLRQSLDEKAGLK